MDLELCCFLALEGIINTYQKIRQSSNFQTFAKNYQLKEVFWTKFIDSRFILFLINYLFLLIIFYNL